MNRTIILADTPAAFWQRTMLMRSLERMGRCLFTTFEDMLEDYYKNNGLYDAIQQALYYGRLDARHEAAAQPRQPARWSSTWGTCGAVRCKRRFPS